ncbi:hypothetical protein ACLJJ6_09940 [Pediococcus siamensis]|uniref:hypothetical protein n=1 Tax=Pediococcus siamensis TaxID=381829 RepID=UPI00399FF4C5
MKFWQRGLLRSLVVVSLAVCVSGCVKTQTKTGRTVPRTPQVAKTSADKQLRRNPGLWYFSKGIKNKSNSGLEAFKFDRKGKVTVYNVKKYYATFTAAKKAGTLHKMGQGTYHIQKKAHQQTNLVLKLKLAGIPATYRFKLKNGVAQRYKGLVVHGFKAVRTVDQDDVTGVFVQVRK